MKFLVISRTGYDFEKICQKYDKDQTKFILTDIETPNLSSTKIRELLKQSNERPSSLDPKVYSYLKKHQLYGIVSR